MINNHLEFSTPPHPGSIVLSVPLTCSYFLLSSIDFPFKLLTFVSEMFIMMFEALFKLDIYKAFALGQMLFHLEIY